MRQHEKTKHIPIVFVTAINTGLAVAGSQIDPASLATFQVAIATFKNARDQYLSSRLRLD